MRQDGYPGNIASRRLVVENTGDVAGSIMDTCEHVDQIQEVTPSGDGCKECLEMGDSWVHLRVCMICGHVGCCDSSKNKHATKHYHETEHAIMKSFEPDEEWGWCYIDELMLDGSGWAIHGPRAHGA
ncbi:MAG TPA: UBP-type zinc finger domain-containing protein [Nitrolancea sp.]